MAFMKGEPLIKKLAAIAMYGVFPGAMLASLVYSPPDYDARFKRRAERLRQFSG